jgi:signal transduction histidine kinase
VLTGLIETWYDYLNEANMGFSAPWLAVILMVGLGTIPFRASQALATGVAMYLVYPMVLRLGPVLSAGPEVAAESSQLVFLAIMVLLGTGISGARYRSRFEAFANKENVRQARDRLFKQREKIRQQHQELEEAYRSLIAAQAQIVQSEKLASLGKLTSGIAHELKNPLNFVNNFAEMNEELARELLEELTHESESRAAHARGESLEIARNLILNSQHIVRNGKRADEIVRTMMQHVQGESGERVRIPVNKVVSEYVALASGAVQIRDDDRSVVIDLDLDDATGTLDMIPPDVGRALVNLISNAYTAVEKRGEAAGDSYTPSITVSSRRVGNHVEISVTDNGIGVDARDGESIFEPFFTTMPPGSGHAGLGLSLAHEIVTQGYGGTLTYSAGLDGGACFLIRIPTTG